MSQQVAARAAVAPGRAGRGRALREVGRHARRACRAAGRGSARAAATTPVRPARSAMSHAQPDVGEALASSSRGTATSTTATAPAGRAAGRSACRAARDPTTRSPSVSASAPVARSSAAPRACAARALAGDRRRERRELAADGRPRRSARLVVAGTEHLACQQGVEQRPQPALLLGDVVLALLEVRRRHDRPRPGRGRSSPARPRGAARRAPRPSPRRPARATPRCRRSGRRAAGPRAACPRPRGSWPTRGTRRSDAAPGSPAAGDPVEAEVHVLADDLETWAADHRLRQPRVARDLVPERAEHDLGELVAIDARDERPPAASGPPSMHHDCDASQQLWRASSGAFGRLDTASVPHAMRRRPRASTT